jgi:hypothetical protein
LSRWRKWTWRREAPRDEVEQSVRWYAAGALHARSTPGPTSMTYGCIARASRLSIASSKAWAYNACEHAPRKASRSGAGFAHRPLTQPDARQLAITVALPAAGLLVPAAVERQDAVSVDDVSRREGQRFFVRLELAGPYQAARPQSPANVPRHATRSRRHSALRLPRHPGLLHAPGRASHLPRSYLRTPSRLERFNRTLRRRIRSANAYHAEAAVLAMIAQVVAESGPLPSERKFYILFQPKAIH